MSNFRERAVRTLHVIKTLIISHKNSVEINANGDNWIPMILMMASVAGFSLGKHYLKISNILNSFTLSVKASVTS